MGQLEDMQLFIRVVEAGSISRAAEQLDIVKSAVSRRLSDLESRLGTRLLNRTTRISSLTDAGRGYYEQSLKIVDNVQELNAQTMDSNCTLEGNIRLAAPLSFGLAHLSRAIDAFLKSHPGISIDIDFSDRQIDLVEGALDLAFRIADLKDSSLVARRIAPINFVLCASPDYLARYGEPDNHEDLYQHQLLRYSLSSSGWQLTDEKEITHKITEQAKINANNGDFLKRMAVAGHGILLIPTFIAWQSIATGELVPIMTQYRLPERNAYAVYPQNRYLSQRTRILIDYLAEYFGDHPYWDQAI